MMHGKPAWIAQANAFISDLIVEQVRMYALSAYRHTARVYRQTKRREIHVAHTLLQQLINSEYVGLTWEALPVVDRLCRAAILQQPLSAHMCRLAELAQRAREAARL